MSRLLARPTGHGERTAYQVNRAPDLWPPLLAAGAALLVLLWVGGSAYKQDLVVLSCTYALIALGMYIPFVMAGSMSMAYSAYAAIGAYAVALLSQHTGLPIWIGWLLGIPVSAAIAVVLALATRRLSGFFLAAVTLLFATAFEHWLGTADSVSGGAIGVAGIREASFFGWEPDRSTQIVIALIAVIVVTALVERLRRSPWGVTLRAIHEQPVSVEASGVRTADLTMVSLAVGAGIASLGGSMFATFVRGITPETFTLHVVFLAVFMPLLGGKGTAWGAVLGGFLVVQLTVNTQSFATGGTLLLALAVLFIMLVAPSGVLGWLDSARRAVWRSRPARGEPAAGGER